MGDSFCKFSLPSQKKNKSVWGRTLLAPIGLEYTFFVLRPHGPKNIETYTDMDAISNILTSVKLSKIIRQSFHV